MVVVVKRALRAFPGQLEPLERLVPVLPGLLALLVHLVPQAPKDLLVLRERRDPLQLRVPLVLLVLRERPDLPVSGSLVQQDHQGLKAQAERPEQPVQQARKAQPVPLVALLGLLAQEMEILRFSMEPVVQ